MVGGARGGDDRGRMRHLRFETQKSCRRIRDLGASWSETGNGGGRVERRIEDRTQRGAGRWRSLVDAPHDAARRGAEDQAATELLTGDDAVSRTCSASLYGGEKIDRLIVEYASRPGFLFFFFSARRGLRHTATAIPDRSASGRTSTAG